MISVQSIENYKASLLPTPETDLRPKTMPEDVQTFNPFAHKLGIVSAAVTNKLADAINTICRHIEFATDERQRELEEERRWVELTPEEEPSAETLDMLDQAYDLARSMRGEIENKDWKPAENAFQWAKQAVVFRNPWEAFEIGFEEMQKSATCSKGLVVLFDDAEATRKAAKGLMQSQVYQNMLSMAKAVCDKAESDLDAKSNKTGNRSADIYRRWAEALRWIVRHEITPKASRVLRELVLDQSLPLAELDNPDWIDPYTGEVDMQITDRVHIKTIQIEEKDEIEVAAAASSEAFNDDDDLEKTLYHLDISTEAMEWDVRDPTWMEIQNDLKPSDEVELLKDNAAVKRFRRAMNKHYNQVLKKGLEREAAAEMVRHNLHAPIRVRDEHTGELVPGKNSEADLLINALNDLAQTHETKDIAYLFLGLQNEFGLEEDEAAQIRIPGSLNNLADWLEIFGDEVMDSLFSTYEPYKYTDKKEEIVEIAAALKEEKEDEPEEQEEAIPLPIGDGEDAAVSYFAEETIREITQRAALDIKGQKRPNIFHHPAFIEGFLRAMSAGSAASYKDSDGVWKSAGVKAGWESWMESFNSTAFRAYQQARRDGLDFEKAKAVFWSSAKANRPKKQDTVTGMIVNAQKVPCGLKLGSGRTIGWNILALKLKGGELIVTDEQRAKLRSMLPTIGQQKVAELL